MKYLLPRNKGMITAVLMIVLSLLSDKLQYVIYCVYVAGILWTLFDHKRVAKDTPTFKGYFSQGFRAFIVVSLLMVIFLWVFILSHPELENEWAANMQVEMSRSKDMLQSDIDTKIANGRKLFLPGYLMGGILSYLSIGALVSVVGAGFLSQIKPNG